MLPRVAIVSNYPVDYRRFTGGVQTATAALLEGLRAYNHEFAFHLLSPSSAIGRDVYDSRDGLSVHFIGGSTRPWLRPRLPLRLAKMRAALHSLRPDLVHCIADPDLALAAILDRERPILTVHGIPAHEASLRTGWEFWSTQTAALLWHVVSRHIDAYICTSRYSASVVGNRRPTFTIPNAVRSPFLHAGLDPAPGPDLPSLIFVGVLAPIKQPADVLRAHAALLGRFPSLQTLLCGPVEDKGYTRKLQQFVADKDLRGVRFLGVVHEDELVTMVRRSSALILPSAQENSPLVIAEAMALGTPVVATRVGGIPELVDDDLTGFLYDPGDVDTLAGSIERLLANPPLRQRLGLQARRVAQTRHTPLAVAAATTAVYRRILNLAPKLNRA